jgi:hypothetical protein
MAALKKRLMQAPARRRSGARVNEIFAMPAEPGIIGRDQGSIGVMA